MRTKIGRPTVQKTARATEENSGEDEEEEEEGEGEAMIEEDTTTEERATFLITGLMLEQMKVLHGITQMVETRAGENQMTMEISGGNQLTVENGEAKKRRTQERATKSGEASP